MKRQKYACFPAVMTTLAALCFVFVYILLLPEPFPLYTKGLLFALPALMLSTVTWLAHKQWISSAMTVHATLWLSVFSVLLSLWYGAFLIFRTLPSA